MASKTRHFLRGIVTFVAVAMLIACAPIVAFAAVTAGTAESGPSALQTLDAGDEGTENVGAGDVRYYFGCTWDELPILATKPGGKTADGHAGITVSASKPLAERFAPPATYRGSRFSKASVTGASIKASRVVSIVIPASVLNPSDDDVKWMCAKGTKARKYYKKYGAGGFNYAVIETCLNYASANYRSDTLYRIVFPAGTYEVGGRGATMDDDLAKCLHVRANTWLDMRAGTTLIHMSRIMPFIRNAFGSKELHGYEVKNIIIDGGRIEGLTESDAGHAEINLGHVSNLVVRNLRINNCRLSHHLELVAVANATISGCEFSGYVGSTPKEAIQIDAAGKASAKNNPVFDYAESKNIVIYGNRFHDLSRGVGTHYVYTGHVFSEILIQNNTFKNLRDQAMLLLSFSNLAVIGNKIEGCPEAMRIAPLFKNSSLFTNTGTAHPTCKNFLLKDNVISTNVTLDDDQSALTVYGNLVGGKQYALRNVALVNNKVSAGNTALCLSNVSAVTVQGGRYTSKSRAALVMRNSAQATMTSAAFASSAASGARVDSSNLALSACTFNRCAAAGLESHNTTVNASKTQFSSNARNGLALSDSTISLSNCQVKGNGAVGIQAKDFTTLTAKASAFDNNKGSGVSAHDSSIALKDTNVRRNGRYGVYVSSSTLKLNKTAVKSNKRDGVRAVSSRTTFKNGSSSTKNGRNGLNIKRGRLNLKSVTFSRNGKCGVIVKRATAKLKSCVFKKNGTYGIYLASKTKVTSLKKCKAYKNKRKGLVIKGKSEIAKLSGNSIR